MSLYRKYRPLNFNTLQGQDHIKEVLQSALKRGAVHHAYLFTGPRGTGKTSTARILARAINCENLSNLNPCNSCVTCLAALNESLTDLIEIDAASHGLVDDARALVDQARFLPVQAKKKIYIIDEVHMLSKSAFNALLKIIEEPPDHVHFILATTEAHKVLETIHSRCLRFDFHLADDEMIFSYLQIIAKQEGLEIEVEAIKLLAHHARGSFRDALSLLEQVMGSSPITLAQVKNILGFSDHEAASKLISCLEGSNAKDAIILLNQVYQEGTDLYQFCQSILEVMRTRLLSSDETNRLKFLSWTQIFFEALTQLKDPILPELPLELAIYKSVAHSPSASPSATVSAPTSITAPPTSTASKSSSSFPPGLISLDPFDYQGFIKNLQHASLRSLLKFSKLSFSGRELVIATESEFELGKIKNSENMEDLLNSLKVFAGEKAYLTFKVAVKTKKNGLSTEDIKSVF